MLRVIRGLCHDNSSGLDIRWCGQEVEYSFLIGHLQIVPKFKPDLVTNGDIGAQMHPDG